MVLRFCIAVFLSLALSVPVSAFSVTVRGGDEASFTPQEAKAGVIKDKTAYDAIIIGGGLAGLSAAVYLTDQNKKVLLLEKEEALGGLAFGGTQSGVGFNRGAAYWTGAYEEELKILEHIGMGHYKDLHAIHEPIDSYLLNGELHLGLWEEETLHHLPASFSLFKHELKHHNDAKLIPNQPIEESPVGLELDAISGAEWIRGLPAKTAQRQDEESKKIYERFLKDDELNPLDPMGDVVSFMDVFCRSALGAGPEKISAVAFVNFYISEIETRYTTPFGTGEAAVHMEKMLRARKKLAAVQTSSPVKKIVNGAEGVQVFYVRDGQMHQADGRYAVFAAQLKFAPKIIEGFAGQDPERAALLNSMEYSHFSIHAVFVKGHPYRATFDTWVRQPNYTESDFTDVILGRWMDPAINGYEGMRDFKKNPLDEKGVMTIYHPMRSDFMGKGYTQEQAKNFAEKATERMLKIFNPMVAKHWGTKIEVEGVETSRWPYSIHIATPGHFTKRAKILRKPLGRVFFANNNIGTPAFEEALFRGHCAANNILKRMDASFKQETWSQCPLEN